MYPRTLLDDEVKSAGETAVFTILREGLDDGWEVFHSVGVGAPRHAEGALGEVGFVVCHPGASSAWRSRADRSSAVTGSGDGAWTVTWCE